jgi:CRP-like cAMP-binding protein
MHSRAKAKRDTFVQVPLWWAEQAALATKTPKAMVWVWLLHLSWKARGPTFKLPNERLHIRGVSRFTKTRALRELEAAGLIQVAWERGKSPVVTLLYL